MEEAGEAAELPAAPAAGPATPPITFRNPAIGPRTHSVAS